MWSTRAIEAHRLLEIYLSHRLTGARRYGATAQFVATEGVQVFRPDSTAHRRALHVAADQCRDCGGGRHGDLSRCLACSLLKRSATARQRGQRLAAASVARRWRLPRGRSPAACGWRRHERLWRGEPPRRTVPPRLKPSGSPASATPHAWPIPGVDPAGCRLTGRALERRLVLAMIKRRAAAAGLPPSTCCHTFRATGITAYLSNGGTLEHAQQIAGHASPKTTKLHDRTADTVTVDEIERIVI